MPNTARLFDPTGIKPEDYRSKYPELKRIPEFTPLTSIALMFVWYYSNPTSMLMKESDDFLRARKALELSKYNPGKSLREDLLKLHFPTDIAIAIDRMARMRADARVRSKLMVENVIQNYEKIISYGPDEYKDKDGEPDRKKYVDTTAKIVDELPKLIEKVEEGFGISTRTEDEDSAYGGVDLSEYYRSNEK